MSVEYYLYCESHNQSVWVCSDGLSGPLLQGDKSLAAFIIAHRNCKLSVFDENSDDPEDVLEWDTANWKELFNHEL